MTAPSTFPGTAPVPPKTVCTASWLVALAVPLAYLFLYVPVGMDTTDFGYFYGFSWRILEGQFPYRDFFYIKPSLPLFWHAFWMKLTPDGIEVLAGKAGFLCSMLAASWFAAGYLSKIFSFEKLGIPLPLLATAGFIFGIHSFPCMPWHTADGILFAGAGIFFTASGWPVLGGVLVACSALCKQSFVLVPAGAVVFAWICRSRSESLRVLLGWLGAHALFSFFLWKAGAWSQFTAMTTGQLDIREALDAGIGIYITQNWLPPLIACLPALFFLARRKTIPGALAPTVCYIVVLAVWYIWMCVSHRVWEGYGLSWPTLLVLLGGVMVFLPKKFTAPWLRDPDSPHPLLRASAGLGLALLVSWSVAISGGYKIPAFFACPLIFVLVLCHQALKKYTGRCSGTALLWLTVVCGTVMFGVGYHYPYVFPVRPLLSTDFVMNAGDIYPKASGVRVDRVMYEKLAELKSLRTKYGSNYKTLPGFTLSYYLNDDMPVISSDWLQNWEINGKYQEVYDELVKKRVTVFMERDQMDAERPDGYERTGYTVPQWVRHRWKQVGETKHFVVFQVPDGQ